MTIKQLLEEIREQLENGFGYLLEVDIEDLECEDGEVDPNEETQIIPRALLDEVVREEACEK